MFSSYQNIIRFKSARRRPYIIHNLSKVYKTTKINEQGPHVNVFIP